MIDISFLIYDERLNNGIIRTQLLDIAQNLGKTKKVSILYICQIFILLKNYSEIKNVIKQYNNVKFILLPFALPSRYVLFNSFLLEFVAYISSNLLYIIKSLLKINILHCRGYYTSYIASKRKMYTNSIADLRSLFLEENISNNKIKENTILEAKWKNIIKIIGDKYNNIIAINTEMKEVLINNYNFKKSKVYILPLVVNMKYFNLFEKKFNIKNKYIYVGSIGIGFWNDVLIYAKYIKILKRIDIDAEFIIISPKIDNESKKLLAEASKNNIVFVENPKREIIIKNMLNCDYGIFFMKPSKDSSTRLGIKTIEYFAAGLPVIANEHAGSAANIIKHKSLGFIIDESFSIECLNNIIINKKNISKNCFLYARRYHSIERYISIYNKLVSI